MARPKLFLDMDNVLVDTLSVLNQIDMTTQTVAKPDQIPGIFRDLPPMPGAVAAVETLAAYYELHILSTAPWQNPSSWQDKLIWLQQYFGDDQQSPFYKRVVMAHDKGLLHYGGGMLIDDRPYHGASAWDDAAADSVWLQFGFDDRLVWSIELVDFLIAVAKDYDKSTGLRSAVAQVATRHDYQIHGDVTTFEKAHWE